MDTQRGHFPTGQTKNSEEPVTSVSPFKTMASSDPTPDSEVEDLRLAHLNICSLRKKVDKVNDILRHHKLHVLALTETHLDGSVENFVLNIENYSLYRKDRNSGGGGVALYIQNQIPVNPRSDLDQPGVEMMWVEIYLPHAKPVLVGCCYRPPNSRKQDLEKICRRIEMVSVEDKDLFLLGDFNIDWLTKKKEEEMKERVDFVSSVCGLTQIVNVPTRETETSSSCIDHIFTNIPELCSEPTSAVPGCSDHKLVTVTVQRSVRKAEDALLQRSDRNTNTDLLSEQLKSLTVRDEGPSLSGFLIKQKIIKYQRSLKFVPVDDKTVESLLSSLHVSVTPGKDEIDALVLKAAAPYISAPVSHIVNRCIVRGEFPSESAESGFFLPVLSQILEKILLQQIKEYFSENKLFTQQQTLDDMTNNWLEEVEKKNLVGAVFLGFSSSSDSISPDLLITKLGSYSFSDSALSMMRSFLSDRKHKVDYDGFTSDCRQADCGLAHFLFSIYTQDLKLALDRRSSVLCGSDLMIYHSAGKHEELKNALRDESQAVREWIKDNRMILKTLTPTTIRSKQQVLDIRKHLKPTLRLNVEQFNWIRLLGVSLQGTGLGILTKFLRK